MVGRGAERTIKKRKFPYTEPIHIETEHRCFSFMTRHIVGPLQSQEDGSVGRHSGG